MKAISLWQPWAQLAATREKGCETRGRNTTHRGFILIHAAKKRSPELDAIGNQDVFREALARHASPLFPASFTLDQLPYGAIVGIACIIDTFQFGSDAAIRYLRGRHLDNAARAAREIRFGDWSEGRWGWRLEYAMPITPIPTPGQQGMWDYKGPVMCPSCGGFDLNQSGQRWLMCPRCSWPSFPKEAVPDKYLNIRIDE